MGCSPGLFVLLPFAILAPLGAAWAQNSAMGTSAPGYEVARSQSVQDAPPGSVGRKTTDREHRVGKTDETRGQEVTYVFTIGGFAHRCPNADGIVDGEFEYTLTYDAVTMVDGEPQRTYKARRLYARLKGQVGDDAKLDHVDLDGTYTTEDNDAGVAPRSTGHAVHTTFRLTNGEPDWGALRSVVEATGEISVAAAVLLVSPVYMAAQNEWGKLNECVELSFDPPSDTRSLGPNESAQVRVGLQTKQGKTPVPWKSDSINAGMGIGSMRARGPMRPRR
jgi:hypothetical protein